MTDNGVSKKLCITTTCISGILGLAANAEDKLPFAFIVASMFALYVIGQGFLDWLKTPKQSNPNK